MVKNYNWINGLIDTIEDFKADPTSFGFDILRETLNNNDEYSGTERMIFCDGNGFHTRLSDWDAWNMHSNHSYQAEDITFDKLSSLLNRKKQVLLCEADDNPEEQQRIESDFAELEQLLEQLPQFIKETEQKRAARRQTSALKPGPMKPSSKAAEKEKRGFFSKLFGKNK